MIISAPALISRMIYPCAINESSQYDAALQVKLHNKFIVSIPRSGLAHAQAAIASIPLLSFFTSSIFPLSPRPGICFEKSFSVKGLASSSAFISTRICVEKMGMTYKYPKYPPPQPIPCASPVASAYAEITSSSVQ